MPSSFDKKIEKEIPAVFYMFAGADDSEQAQEVDNVGTFSLPDPAGKHGGACTAALLQVVINDEADDSIDYSWTETLALMREKIEDIGLTSIPCLSSSRPIDVNETMKIVPDGYDGVRRAMLIGINYVGQKGELKACWNDTRNVKEFLMNTYDFKRENMLILMDDGKHHMPTKQMIMDGFHKLVEISEPGDVVFIQFSGHGGQVVDVSGDEDDGFDEILCPVDLAEAGHILDDDIYAEFVTQMPAGVAVTAIIDCCHSGTAMDLPYTCAAGDEAMKREEGFKLTAPAPKSKAAKKKKKTDKAEKTEKTEKPEKKKKKSSSKKKSEESEEKPEKKKKAKKEKKEKPPPEDEDEEDVEEEAPAEESTESPKKKKGLLGVFGRKKK